MPQTLYLVLQIAEVIDGIEFWSLTTQESEQEPKGPYVIEALPWSTENHLKLLRRCNPHNVEAEIALQKRRRSKILRFPVRTVQ